MNGWYPRWNPDGSHLASGSSEIWIDGHIAGGAYCLGQGGTPAWIDKENVIFHRWIDGQQYQLVTCNVVTGVLSVAQDPAYVNDLSAGGGSYAWSTRTGVGTGVHTSTGFFDVNGFLPAINGGNLAYLKDAALPQQRLVVNNNAIVTASITLPHCNNRALVWNQWEGKFRAMYGLKWAFGTIERIQPSYDSCFEGWPMEGPDGLYLLAYDNHRLMITKWGETVGWLVSSNATFYPHGVWNGSHWQVAWSDAQGNLGTAYMFPTFATQDFAVDPRPPVPPPIIDFTMTGVVGAVTVRENVSTHRWMLDGTNAATPNDGMEYDFSNAFPGTHRASLKALGLPDDPEHASGTGGQIVITPEQEFIVAAPNYPVGWLFVQTGFGEPRGDALYTQLWERGWEGARVEASYRYGADNPGITTALVQEVLNNRLRPITICRTHADLEAVPEWTDVEWQNEPNGSVPPGRYWPPAEYAASLHDVIAICLRRHLRLWVGSINNLSRDGLNYLSSIISEVPFDCGISVHRYPEKNLEFSAAHAGFSSRHDEVVSLKRIIGTRPFIVTEYSYTQKPRKTCFRTVPGLTNNEVKDRMTREEIFWNTEGAQGLSWFQIDEVETDNGLRDASYKWKEPQSRQP